MFKHILLISAVLALSLCQPVAETEYEDQTVSCTCPNYSEQSWDVKSNPEDDSNETSTQTENNYDRILRKALIGQAIMNKKGAALKLSLDVLKSKLDMLLNLSQLGINALNLNKTTERPIDQGNQGANQCGNQGNTTAATNATTNAATEGTTKAPNVATI